MNVELLKAQIANEYAQGGENKADELLKNAKADTEIAKTKVLYSTADNQDLDFLHKRDGTAEKRALEASDSDYANKTKSKIMEESMKQGDNSNGVKKVPNKTMNDAQIPVIDLPQELLQPSDLY